MHRHRILVAGASIVLGVALMGASVRNQYGLFNDATGAQIVDSITTIAGSSTASPAYTRLQDGSGTNAAAIDANGVLSTSLRPPGASALVNFYFPSNGDGIASASSSSYGFVVSNLAFNGTSSDRIRKDIYASGPLWTTTGGSGTSTIAAGTVGVTVVKNSAGRLVKIMVTAVGAAELDCYDNASAAAGTKIGVIAASAAIGTVATFDMPAANGITCSGSASNPAVTISYY